jgi:hypothetical protein
MVREILGRVDGPWGNARDRCDGDGDGGDGIAGGMRSRLPSWRIMVEESGCGVELK